MHARYDYLTHASAIHDVPGFPKIVLSAPPHKSCGEWQWCINTGLNGYIVSRRGAQKMLNLLTPLRMTIDLQLGEMSEALNMMAVRKSEDYLVRREGLGNENSVRVGGDHAICLPALEGPWMTLMYTGGM